MDENKCTCGIPSQATYYVSAIIGHDMENYLGRIGYTCAVKDGVDVDVRDIDGYYCGKHVPSKSSILLDELKKYNFAVLEYKRSKLR